MKKSQWTPISERHRASQDLMWVTAKGSPIRIAFWAPGKQYECLGSVGGGWIDYYRPNTGPKGLQFLPTHCQPLPEPLE